MYVSVQGNLDLAAAQAEVSNSFLCSQRGGTTCKACHDSCQACNPDGTCTGCKDIQATLIETNVACVCRGRFGSDGDPFMAGCALCHPSCEACEWAADPTECFSCVAAFATTTDPLGGYCYCNAGYEDRESPTSDCAPCDPSCSHCSGGSIVSCMSEEQAAFNRIAAALHNLPLVAETDGMICYRTPTTGNDCTLAAIEAITTDIHTANPGSLSPTPAQCHQLLKAEWAMLTYWFNHLFPTFAPPPTTDRDYLVIKTILQLWILQFGPYTMKNGVLWKGVTDAFNLPSDQWGAISADETNYSVGSGPLNYPLDLAAWLALHPADLQAFNTFSY